jgi:hypothetical protein
MNGKVAKRIRHAAYVILLEGFQAERFKGLPLHEIIKILKREYKAKPYCKRNLERFGYSVTHKQQRKRWLNMKGIK